jgi:nucleoside-diphosphate-sugar epimerase
VRVLISGCGYVGSSLGLLLTAQGHTTFGLRRNTTALPPAILPVQADLSASLPPDALPPNLDALVYAASPAGATDEAYRAAYVDGLRNLLSALAPQGSLRRFVFVSSTGVYAQREGEWVDEESPTEPQSYSGRRLLEGERVVLGSTFSATILRLGGIYGPGRTGTIDRALREAPEEKDPSRYTNRIHRDDCAGALRHLLLLRDPAPVYLGVDHEPTTRQEIHEWLTAQRYTPPLTLETSSRNTPRGASRTRTNKRCSNARLISSGYRFRYPTFREGFATLLDGVNSSAR